MLNIWREEDMGLEKSIKSGKEHRQEIFKRNIDKRGNIVVELRCKEEAH